MDAPSPLSPALPLPRRKLPIGIQTLAKIRSQACYYVDKTALIVDLIEAGTYYFLSRPSRAGTGRRAMRSSASASPTGCCATAPSWTGASATSCA